MLTVVFTRSEGDRELQDVRCQQQTCLTAWPGVALQVVGQKIAQLEARKRSAVEKEDYDTAKTIKVGWVRVSGWAGLGWSRAQGVGCECNHGPTPHPFRNVCVDCGFVGCVLSQKHPH